MSLNRKQYYTSGRTLKSKGNQTMLNSIEKNAYNPTRKLTKKRESFVNSELDVMKRGGLTKMSHGDEVTTFPYFPKVKTEAEKEEEARLAMWPAYRSPNLTAEQTKQLHEDSKFTEESRILKEWAESMGGYKPPVFNRPDSYEDYDYKTGWQRGSLSDEEKEYEKEWLENYYYPKYNQPQRTYTFSKSNLESKKLTNILDKIKNPKTFGYKFKNGGLTKMDNGGGFLDRYAFNMQDPDRKKGLTIGAGTQYGTYTGLTGSLNAAVPFKLNPRDVGGLSSLQGSAYAGRTQFGPTKGFSLGYGYDNQKYKSFFRGDAGYDQQLGAMGTVQAGQRFPFEFRDKKRRADYTGSFGYGFGFGVHSKNDPRTSDVIPTMFYGSNEQRFTPTPAGRNVKYQFGLQGDISRELGPGKLTLFGKANVDPTQGKFRRRDLSVPVEEDRRFIDAATSGQLEWSPSFTVGAKYDINKQFKDRKIQSRIEKQKAKEEAILREQEAIARREEERKRQQQGESEFVKEDRKQFGGEVMELTDKEIKELRKGGHIVIEQ
jgi:hypothetical protein